MHKHIVNVYELLCFIFKFTVWEDLSWVSISEPLYYLWSIVTGKGRLESLRVRMWTHEGAALCGRTFWIFTGNDMRCWWHNTREWDWLGWRILSQHHEPMTTTAAAAGLSEMNPLLCRFGQYLKCKHTPKLLFSAADQWITVCSSVADWLSWSN